MLNLRSIKPTETTDFNILCWDF